MGTGRKASRARTVGALAAAVLVLTGGGGSPRGARGADAPLRNLVLITLDDCRADVLAGSGTPFVRTPNLDRLAAAGVRFTAAFAQSPSCNPSRTSFLTGRNPPATGVFLNSDDSRALMPERMQSLPQILDRAGFAMASVGKLFHLEGEQNAVDMAVFDRLELSARPEGWIGPDPIADPPPPEAVVDRPKRGTKEHLEFRRKNMDRYGRSGLDADQEKDARGARAAAELLRVLAADGRRFFLSYGTSLPHAPLLCPAPYVERQDPAQFALPPGRDADQDIPAVAVRYGLNADLFPQRQPTEAEARAATAAYQACVSFADEQIGRVLDALEESGVADETVVVLLSDQGFHLGEHGHWSKYTLFEQSLNVPLLVRVPGAEGNGRIATGLVELVDLLPTLGELLGVEMPPDLEGSSFAAQLRDPGRPGKRAAFAWFKDPGGMHRTVRTERYRYARWELRGRAKTLEELYDLWTDPQQRVNRAADRELANVRSELAGLLDAVR